MSMDKLEEEIRSTVRRFPSDKVLSAVHHATKNSTGSTAAINQIFPLDKGGFRPFIAAGISAFAIRFSNPNRYTDKEFTLSDLANLYKLVFDYLAADPITTDEEVAKEFYKSNPVFMILRLVASQFPFEVNTFGYIGQPLLLFGELPKVLENKKEVPKFDFSGAFQN